MRDDKEVMIVCRSSCRGQVQVQVQVMGAVSTKLRSQDAPTSVLISMGFAAVLTLPGSVQVC